ncbi:MAG: putative toxin-antitoxin system toxin component, PIN family [Gemmatimonadetes bacterium]|nr:putative toxin-antitoxin system toxin component, PIN family [Gemmatimonadota bacterium]
MRVVLDTNVIVSALLSPAGAPGRVLDLLSTGRIVALYDDRMLGEYRDVLPRPGLKLSDAVVGATLDFIRREGLLVLAPPLRVDLPDPDDRAFIEVAAEGGAVAIITGNIRHFAAACALVGVPAMTPAEFIRFWRDQDLPGSP